MLWKETIKWIEFIMTKWIIYLLWSLISIKWLQIEFVSQKSFLLMWSQQLCHRYCSGPNNLWNWHNWRINEWKVWRMYCHISYVSHFNDETSLKVWNLAFKGQYSLCHQLPSRFLTAVNSLDLDLSENMHYVADLHRPICFLFKIRNADFTV